MVIERLHKLGVIVMFFVSTFNPTCKEWRSKDEIIEGPNIKNKLINNIVLHMFIHLLKCI